VRILCPCVLTLQVEKGMGNAYGTMHGGAVASLVDIVGTLALLSRDSSRCVASDLQIGRGCPPWAVTRAVSIALQSHPPRACRVLCLSRPDSCLCDCAVPGL